MTGIFVTATGTELGKSFICAQLLRLGNQQKISFLPSKPVISGWPTTSNDIVHSDTGILLTASDLLINEENIAAVSPWRYTLPLSPDMAAIAEGHVIDIDALIDFCHKRSQVAKQQGKIHLIEGVGGLMSPINGAFTNLEWLIALKCPCILIAGSYLGSLSHTLTALKVLTMQNVTVRAVVVNETRDSTVGFRDTVNYLKRYIAPIPVLSLTHQSKAPITDSILSLYRLIV